MERNIEHFVKNLYLHKFNALKPLVELAAQRDPADFLAWWGTREVLRDLRDMLVIQYAWAIPDSRALELIAGYGPIVEVGAGTGYWAMLLRKLGVDIVAYDAEPRAAQDDNSEQIRSWTEVLRGTAEEAVTLHPERTLFLCWPPAAEPMAAEALSCTKAQHVIFVGWKGDDMTGDFDFHGALAKDWRLMEDVAIPSWPEMKDRLYVYRRR